MVMQINIGVQSVQWLCNLDLYLVAEREPMPVAQAVTYLRGIALEWWEHLSATIPMDAPFSQFKRASLARFVKPSVSANA